MKFSSNYIRFIIVLSFLFCANPSLAIQDGALEDYEQEAVRNVVTNFQLCCETPTAEEIIRGTQGILPDSEDAIIAVTMFVADQGLLASQPAAAPTADDAMVAQLLQLQLDEDAEQERATQRAAEAIQEEDRCRAYLAHQETLAALAAQYRPGKAKLDVIIEQSQPYANSDVHEFNAKIVKANYPIVRALDIEHFAAAATAPARPVAEVSAEIKAFAAAQKLHPLFPRAAEYFATIMSYPAGQIEAETGIDPITLFSRLWVLAKDLDADRLKAHEFLLPTGHTVDARTLMYYSIHENRDTNGGCWPGFAGRLFQVYLQLLSSKMS